MNNLQNILCIFFFIPFVWSDQLQNQRGMTNLLGYETYQRCSEQMSNPESKIYELSYKRTSTMPFHHLLVNINPNFFLKYHGLVLNKYLQWMY